MLVIDFLRRKYGEELLVDVGWVHDFAGFAHDGAPHRLAFYDVMLVTAGSGWYELDGRRHAVAPGRVFFTSPGQVRRWAVHDLDGLCLFFVRELVTATLRDTTAFDRLPFFHRPQADTTLTLSPREAAGLRRRLTAMTRELPRLAPDAPDLLVAMLLETLFSLARRFVTEHGAPPATPRSEAIIERFRSLLDASIREHHDVGFYATSLGLPPRRLSALCRQADGRGAKAWISERLLVEARRLLRDEALPVAAVAEQLGFVDPSYFGRFYRRRAGSSPGARRGE